MATSNFKFIDKLYVVELEDECSYGDFIDNAQCFLSELDKKTKSKSKKIDLDIYAIDKPYAIRRNNDDANVFGQVRADTTFMDIDVRIEMDLLIRNGYYSDANIDYACNISVDGIDANMDEDADYLFGYLDLSHYPEGLIEMNKKNLDKRLESMKKLLLETFNLIGKTLGTEYEVEQRFSNGETFYGKANTATAPLEMLNYAA